MAVKIYACLAGDWVCLTDEPNCKIGEDAKTPYLWWEEGSKLWSPIERPKQYEHTYSGIDYVHIRYKGNDWRINPIFLQIVNG